MTKRFVIYATTAATLSAIALAATPVFQLSGRTPKAVQKTYDGYTFPEPVDAAVPHVRVKSSDKRGYDHLDSNDMRFDLDLKQECGGGEWSQQGVPTVRIGNRSWPSGQSAGGGKPAQGTSYRPVVEGLRQELGLLNWPGGAIASQCDRVVREHTLDGRLPAALLQHGFWIRVDNVATARATSSCVHKPKKEPRPFQTPPPLDSPTAEVRLPAWIHCLPTGYVPTVGPGQSAGGQALPPPFSAIDLSVENSGLARVCPVSMLFRGRFTANRSLRGRYRLVGNDGYASDYYPFDLKAGAARNLTWRREVRVENKPGGLAAPGVSGWPRTVTGWLQLEVLADEANAKPHRSEPVPYRAICQQPPGN